MITVRPFVEEDFPMISKWWKNWNGVHLERDDVPNHGFVAETSVDDTKMAVASCFLYISNNSKVFHIGYPVACSTKSVLIKEKHEGLEACIKACTNAAVNLGGKRVISMSDKRGLSRIYSRLGYVTLRQHSFHVYGVTEP